MKLIYHPKELTFKDLFKKYGLNPSDETTLFLLPHVSVVQEIENYFCTEGIWGKNLLTFNELSDFVNEVSPNLKKKMISRTQSQSAIRKAAESVSGNLEVFGEFPQSRDFLNAVASIILKLKQNRVSPQDLVGFTERIKSRGLRRKLSDIRSVYKKYEELLAEKEFLDSADSVRVVSQELERGGLAPFFPSAEKLAVLGFSDFTLCELDVIKSLSSAVSETFFFLSDFGDLDEYRKCLLDRLSQASLNFKEDFKMLEEASGHSTASELCEFRDSHDEIEYVSKTIKKLILDGGHSASDFKVLVRTGQRRSSSIASIFEKNGIAVDIRNSGTLAGSVYGCLADDILRLKSGNFHIDDLMRFLHNPLLTLYLEDSEFLPRCVNKIKELSSGDLDLKYRTVSGIVGWKKILEHIAGKDNRISSVARGINSALGLISSKFGRRSFAAMTSDLRKIFSELKVSESSALLIKENKTTRECFDELFSFLRDLSVSYGEFDFRVSDTAEYLSLLNEFMAERTVNYETPCDADSERVGFIDFSDARGINPGFLFIVGISDTSFPSRFPVNPLLKSWEKAEINRVFNSRVFDEEGFHYEKQKHLFTTLSVSASEKIFFSCFRYDERLNKVTRSDFLEGMEFSPAITYPEAFSGEDALFHCLSSSGAPCDDPKIVKILKQHYGSDIVAHLSGGILAERKRLALTGAYTDFEGVLQSAYLKPEDVFSPTELEDYGTCPFRYFSKRVLGLRVTGDIDEQGASHLDLGSLAHSILKDFMETVFAEDPGSVDAGRFLDVYGEIKKKYESKPGVFSHLPQSVAETERKRFFDCILPNFIADELLRIEKDNHTPRFFEKEVEFRINDTLIRGKVDRVDVDGQNVAVIDYKTGKVKGRKCFDFKNLQLPLYLKALCKEGFIPSWGRYFSISSPADESSIKNFSVDEAVSLSQYYIKSIKNGFFPPYIDKKEADQREHALSYDVQKSPCSYCDYKDLCRVKDGVIRKID